MSCVYVQCWTDANERAAGRLPGYLEGPEYQSFRSCPHLQAGLPPGEADLWPGGGVLVQSSGMFLEEEGWREC